MGAMKHTDLSGCEIFKIQITTNSHGEIMILAYNEDRSVEGELRATRAMRWLFGGYRRWSAPKKRYVYARCVDGRLLPAKDGNWYLAIPDDPEDEFNW